MGVPVAVGKHEFLAQECGCIVPGRLTCLRT
jgi:hypothetical protein